MRPENIEDVYPLSPLQEGLVFHTLNSPGSGIYVVQLACELRGELESEAFKSVWQGLLARHAVLRTAFVWEGLEQPLQVVCRDLELPLAVLDWSDRSPAAQELELEAFLADDQKRGFELNQAPLMRLTLCRLGETRHHLVWTYHHLILDGWSLQLLMREIFTLYAALCRSNRYEPPRPRPYRDYIAWLVARDLAAAEAFWQRELKGFTAPTPLPAKVPPRRIGAKLERGVREVRLAASSTGALSSLARRCGLTVNTLVQGVWAVILSRVSGEHDVVFGFVVAGRPPSIVGVEDMVGLFLNTLPVRIVVEKEARVSRFMNGLQEAQVRLRDFEHTPLRQIRSWSEVPRGTELFHTLLDFSYYGPSISADASDSPLAIVNARVAERPDYPLAVIFGLGETLSLKMLYSTAQLDMTAVARIQGYFICLLKEIVQDPEQRLEQLPWLTRAERRQLVGEWNDTAMTPSELTVHALFAARARQVPDAAAVVFGALTRTYSAVGQWAACLARRLRRQGVRRGDLVGVLLDRCWEMVPTLLGILEAGGAYVPLDAEYPAVRIRRILSSLEVRWLVTQTNLLTRRPDTVADLPRLEHLTVVDRHLRGGAVEGVDPDGRAARRAAGGHPPGELHAAHGSQDDLAYVIFTSGSTGAPKGVMVPHGAVVNLIRWVNGTFEVSRADQALFITSLCFDLSVYDIFGLLAAGGAVRVAAAEEVRDPSRLVQKLCEEPVTFWNSAPAVMQQMVPLLPDCAAAADSRLRLVFLSGDWIPVTLPDRIRSSFQGARVIALGGATEATVWSNYFPIARVDAAWSSIPYGRPMDNARYHVLDSGLAPDPVGVAGDLFIAGGCLASGYARSPSLTAWKFLPDPFAAEAGGRMYRTGDRSRFWPDGRLEFLGRLDHQVKIRGFRIELGEIEANLSEHRDVREVAVLAREDEPGRKRLVAYVVASRTAPPREELRRFLAERLPEHMVPAVYVFLEALPLTANGKLDRGALPAPETRTSAGGGFVPPRGEREHLLAALWSEVLRIPRVGRHDNFFELGGDSILSIQIVSRANQAGMRLTPAQVFEHQTVAELAAAARRVAEVAAEQGTLTGELPLTPVQHWFFDQQLPDAHHFNQSLLLEAGDRLDAANLAGALQALLAHHDALRLRFERNGDGWRQWMAGLEGRIPFTLVELGALPPEPGAAALAECVGEAQASLRLGSGPLLRILLLRQGAGRNDRLLLVSHHLAVDGLSWRILLEDLQTAYAQLHSRATVELPAKTTSYKRWAEELEALAASTVLEDEVAWWLAVPPLRPAPLPVDLPEERNRMDATEYVTLALEREETLALLRRAPEAYRTQINDLLLAALAEAVEAWTGARGVLLKLEGHGREELFEGVDVSRSVGWFTSIFPVWLDPGSDETGARIKAVKETLRRIPRRGVGYGLLRYAGAAEVRRALAEKPWPQVSFNYLGQLDTATATDAAWRLAPEPAGPERSLRQPRQHLIDVSAHVHGDRLHVAWTYSNELHRRTTIEALAEDFLIRLRRLVEHCCSPGAGGRTPSDFPLAALDQATLDRVVADGRGIEDLYPLSPLQQGMLFHALHDRRSGIYCQHLSCVLEGKLDAQALQAAWQWALDRHPVLRTAFVWDDLEEPLQLVHRRAPLSWRHLDWRGLDTAAQAAELESLLRRDREKGFDFGAAPLMRMCLIRLAETEHRLIWTHHHLLLDGWSLPILFSEIFAAYGACAEDRQIRVGAPPRPYRDFIAWLAGQDLAGPEVFWRGLLAGFTSPTPVAARRGTSGRESEVREFGRLSVRLPSTATAGLETLARGRQLTLNSILLGAWGLLLARYNGHDDVVFGTVSAGRPADLAGAEGMVGPFLNTLPVRIAVPGHARVAPWLVAVQQTQVASREYEFTPLRRIREWSDLPAGAPLFDSLVIFENYPVNTSLPQEVSGVRVRDVAFEERTNYPFVLVGVPGEALDLELVFDHAVCEPSFAGRALRHLAVLLGAFAADPRQPLAAVPLLTRAERQALLGEWNLAALSAAEPRCVHHLFERQVARTPERVAVVSEQTWLTYAVLDSRANQTARQLRALGVGDETPVGICLERSSAMVVAILGILKAGGAWVPLDPAHPRQRIAFILRDVGAPVVVTRRQLAAVLPPGPHLLSVDADAAAIPARRAGNLAVGAPRGLAYVIYTSGSTGLPKGVMVEHRSAVNLLAGLVAAVIGIRETPLRATLNAPLIFDASVQQLVLLQAGHTLHVVPESVRRDGAAFVAFLRRHALHLLDCTPSQLHILLAAGLLAEPPASLETVLCAGEAIDRETWDALRLAAAPKFYNIYGPTECTVDATSKPLAGAIGEPAIGRPLSGYEALVLDRRLRLVPVGVSGEICLGGVGLARGYVSRPALTADRFVPHSHGRQPGSRLYRTGDLARSLPNGELSYMGRNDAQVKIRGVRIEPGEIEAAIAAHPRVRRVAVMPVGDGHGLVRLAAYLVANGEAPSHRELRETLRDRLPEALLPAYFIPLDDLPLTPQGKIDRKALPAPDGSRPDYRPYRTPGTPTEKRMADVWAELLAVDRIGAEDDFFELGGDSLVAMRLTSRLRRVFEVEVPLDRFFAHPTVAETSELVDRLQLELAASAGEQELADLLAEIESLPDEALNISSADTADFA